MGVCDVVEHLVQHAVVTVDGGESAAEPVPFVGVVVGESRVSVLEIGDEDQESVDDEEGDAVDADEPPKGEARGETVEEEGDGEDAGVGDEDLGALAVGVDGAVRVEVAGEARVGAAGDVEGEVKRPAKSEGDEEGEETTQGVVEVFGEPGEPGFGFGDEDLIAIEGAGVGVVPAVRVFPGEVRHH